MATRIARDYKPMRVELSTPGPADEAEFLAAMIASRELHNPWIFPPLTPEDYADYLAKLGERKAGFIARRLEDGAIVGWLNVSEIIRGALEGAFLGYAGIAGHTGQGYMSEALAARAARGLRNARPAPRRGQHPAGQPGLDRARPQGRFQARGLLSALPEDRRRMARS